MNTRSSGKSTNAGPPWGTAPRRTRRRPAPGSPACFRPSSRACSAVARTARGRSPAASRCPSARRRSSAEHNDRRVAGLRGGHRAHPVRHARPGGQRAHAGLARDLRPALGGERRRGLVAHVDDVDALLAAAVVDREQMPAGQREQLAHAVGLQAPRDEPSAVKGLHASSLLTSLAVEAPTLALTAPRGRPRGRCPGWDSNPHALASRGF